MSTKTAATHTPGPWTTVTLGHAERRQTQIRDEAGEIVIAAMPIRYTAEAEATARLIAAAPEMYDTLKGIAEDAHRFFMDEGDIDAYDLAGAIRDMANAALSRAEGRTP
jgi:hypothetical protein